MNPSPNLPKKEKEHLPAWGNMELQNYDTASATGTSGGLEIKSTVRGLTEEDLKKMREEALADQGYVVPKAIANTMKQAKVDISDGEVDDIAAPARGFMDQVYR